MFKVEFVCLGFEYYGNCEKLFGKCKFIGICI